MARLDHALQALLRDLDDLAATARARGQADPRALLLSALACIVTAGFVRTAHGGGAAAAGAVPADPGHRAQLPWRHAQAARCCWLRPSC
jgi:hypothetical protein